MLTHWLSLKWHYFQSSLPFQWGGMIWIQVYLFSSRRFSMYKGYTTKDDSTSVHINSLAPGKCGSNFNSMIFKLIIQNSSLGTYCDVTLMWMQLNLTNGKSTLAQVMAWCRQALSHYLGQCCPRFIRHMASLGHRKLTLYQHYFCRGSHHKNIIVNDNFAIRDNAHCILFHVLKMSRR